MQAVIFDMNGVIINDEKFHNESWEIFCQKYGLKLSEEEFKTQVMGKRDEETLEYLFKKKLSTQEVENYGDERDAIVQHLINNKLFLANGLLTLLEELKASNIPLAIATSSRKNYANFIVDLFNIRKYFRLIVTAEEVAYGKPNPEIYLKTAAKLQVNPANCIVFEDSLAGIKAAKSARMGVVAITTTLSKEQLNLADKVINSFTEISAEKLRAI